MSDIYYITYTVGGDDQPKTTRLRARSVQEAELKARIQDPRRTVRAVAQEGYQILLSEEA